MGQLKNGVGREGIPGKRKGKRVHGISTPEDKVEGRTQMRRI